MTSRRRKMLPNILVAFLSLFGTTDAIVESNTLRALATYLSLEACDLYILELSATQLSTLSDSNLVKPFYIIDNNKPSVNFAKTKSVCQAVVHNADLKDKFGNLFRRRYVLNFEQVAQMEPSFSAPIVLFTPGGDTIDVKLSCPNADQFRRLNVWRLKNGFWNKPTSQDHSCPNALQSQMVKISVFGLPPYVVMSKKKEIRGIDIEVLKIVAEKMRIKYRLTWGGTWGTRINGTAWTGITGEVLSGAADIGIGHVIMNDERKAVLDFTTPLYNEDLYFISTKPKPKPPYRNILRPFRLSVWVTLLASLAAATAALFISAGIHGNGLYNWDDLVACFKVQVLQSGTLFTTNRQAPHVIFGFYCIFAFFTAGFFLCNFRSYLMQVEYERPIETAEDIVNLGRDIYLPPGGIYQSLFSQSPNAAMRELYRSTTAKNLSFTYVNGLIPKNKVDEIIKAEGVFINGRYNGVVYLQVFDKMYGRVPMRLSKNPVLPFYSGFMMAKKSPWKEEMDMVILRLIQGGIITRLGDNSVSPRYLREESPDDSPVAFRVAHVFGSLMLLIIGLTLGFIAFLSEMLAFNMTFVEISEVRI